MNMNKETRAIIILLIVIAGAIGLRALLRRGNVPRWGRTEWAEFEDSFEEWEKVGRP